MSKEIIKKKIVEFDGQKVEIQLQKWYLTYPSKRVEYRLWAKFVTVPESHQQRLKKKYGADFNPKAKVKNG